MKKLILSLASLVIFLHRHLLHFQQEIHNLSRSGLIARLATDIARCFVSVARQRERARDVFGFKPSSSATCCHVECVVTSEKN